MDEYGQKTVKQALVDGEGTVTLHFGKLLRFKIGEEIHRTNNRGNWDFKLDSTFVTVTLGFVGKEVTVDEVCTKALEYVQVHECKEVSEPVAVVCECGEKTIKQALADGEKLIILHFDRQKYFWIDDQEDKTDKAGNFEVYLDSYFVTDILGITDDKCTVAEVTKKAYNYVLTNERSHMKETGVSLATGGIGWRVYKFWQKKKRINSLKKQTKNDIKREPA